MRMLPNSAPRPRWLISAAMPRPAARPAIGPIQERFAARPRRRRRAAVGPAGLRGRRRPGLAGTASGVRAAARCAACRRRRRRRCGGRRRRRAPRWPRRRLTRASARASFIHCGLHARPRAGPSARRSYGARMTLSPNVRPHRARMQGRRCARSATRALTGGARAVRRLAPRRRPAIAATPSDSRSPANHASEGGAHDQAHCLPGSCRRRARGRLIRR